jgi:hypothetical protein
MGMNPHTEETLARALRALPAAPEAWIEAAKEMPAHRARLDDLVARAETGAEFRDAVLADLDSALRDADLVPEPATLAALRARLDRERPD